jgi:acyl-CoA synthetase
VARAYRAAGYWGDRTLSQIVARRATDQPDGLAVVTETSATTWAGYHALADQVARGLVGTGLAPGQRVGVLLPDGPGVHAAFIGADRAGLVSVGLGARAGAREVDYLLASTGSRALVTLAEHRGQPTAGVVQRARAAGAPIDHHLVLPDPADPDPVVLVDGSAVESGPVGPSGRPETGPDDLFLINSTSGTTGLPKRVMQFQNRWFYFHQLVEAAIDLGPDDVFMSAIPAPFGFGLWTAHFTPAILGVPVVVMERFAVDRAVDLLAEHRVTVLCCVSTQFVMMLGSDRLDRADLGSLRAVFTGGEAVPYHRAAEFEDRTGARILQFYGSNETGAFSNTSMADSREDRLTTSGRVIATMAPRLFDEGRDVTATGGPGQPACQGPATCAGYYDDPEGNARLFTDDGWLLMEDVATVDPRGYVRLTGRKTDFIIRGGKNISAAAVEDAVGTHPAVVLVAAVGVPDDVFGERVGVFVVLRARASLTLDELVAHLRGAGYSPESFPEHLFVVDDLPRASGGKVAKGQLKAQVAGRDPRTPSA